MRPYSNYELQSVDPNITSVLKSRRIRWELHAARMGEVTNIGQI